MINLLYCGNRGVFDGVLTSLLSVVKRTENPAKLPLNVYVFTMDLTYIDEKYVPIGERERELLCETLRSYNPESRVTVIDVTELYREEFSGSPNEDAYCSPYTLIRLLADRVADIPDKLLYLDADIMFNRDIRLLYEIDVEAVEYAAARDHYGKYLINPNYINAGVLLLNMKKIRESGLFTRARALLRKKKLVFADQSAIIRETTSKKLLSQKFNDQKFLHRNTVVRHFSKRLFYLPYPHTENIKQWQISRIHKKFGYYCFDDILYEYIYLKEKYEREKAVK